MRVEAKRAKRAKGAKGSFFVLFALFASPLFTSKVRSSKTGMSAFLATAPAVAAQTPRELSRDDKWREDLKYLFTELPKRHKNLFFKITLERFDREIARIIESVPKLSDSEIKLALRRLTAMIGDPHTRIQSPKEKTYPVTLYQFSDGVFVTATTDEYKSALGAKLVKIGEADIERAKEDIRPLITFENEWRFKQQFPYYLTDPENLHLLKILPSADEGNFTFVDGNGNQFFLKPRP